MIWKTRSSDKLQASKKLAAFVTRHLPVNIRRVRMWRDQIYIALGAGGWEEDDSLDRKWPDSLQKTQGQKSRMKMALDLTDWMQRRTYFTGRFYQEDLEELLSAILRPGDNFVDVGANIGLVTLHAASIIGKTGRLWAFEPNPPVFARLVQHLRMNALDTSRTFNVGLGKRRGKLTLNLFGRHTGKASLLDHGSEIAKTVQVEVWRGEDALEELDVTRPTVFKIDVEGFEAPVLQGLGKLLHAEVALVIEISESWLEAAGSSAAELFGHLDQCGLKPFVFELVDARFSRRLVVRPLEILPGSDQYDCLFMRVDSNFAHRLQSILQPTYTTPVN